MTNKQKFKKYSCDQIDKGKRNQKGKRGEKINNILYSNI